MSNREACLQLCDQWIRMAVDADKAADREAPNSMRREKAKLRARLLQTCATELRELMGPVRRG